MRRLIAIAIAVIAVLGYFGRSALNPVTGQQQHLAMSPEQEIALGEQTAPDVAQQFGGLDPDDGLQTEVQRIGNAIAQASEAGQTPYKFTFHVLADPATVNAFSLPGGPVYITHALLARLGDEAELAGVLGHEMGHVVARHSSEQIARTQLAQALVTAVGVASSDNYDHQRQSEMIASVAAQLATLRYGRRDEIQADTLGVRFMSEAGWDPRALEQVMQILAESRGGSGQPEFMSTHPDPGNRAQIIDAAIARRFPGGVPGRLRRGGALHVAQGAVDETPPPSGE